MSQELVTVTKQLTRARNEYTSALPATLDFDKMRRSVVTACSQNAQLLNCDRRSLLSAAMSAAMLGLEVASPLQHAHLVPFKGKVQMIPGYPGYVMLADNSRVSLQGVVVRQLDEFDYQYGTSPHLHHKPPTDGERGEITHAYAIAASHSWPSKFGVMDLHEILAIRDRSAGYKYAVAKGKTDSVWQVDFPAMARKSPIRQIAKQVPLRVLHVCAAFDDAAQMGRVAYLTPDDQLLTQDPGEDTSALLPS